MELPIQLSFFKKLDAYQALLEQNEHETREPDTKPWGKEKEFLKWAALKHHHLGSPIDLEGFKKKVKELRKYNGKEKGFSKAFENLKVHGYAVEAKSDDKSIILTKEGLLMGRVIVDVEKKGKRHKWKYPFWLLVGWVAVVSAIIIVVSNAYSSLPFLPPFEELVSNFYRFMGSRSPSAVAIFVIFAGALAYFIIYPMVNKLDIMRVDLEKFRSGEAWPLVKFSALLLFIGAILIAGVIYLHWKFLNTSFNKNLELAFNASFAYLLALLSITAPIQFFLHRERKQKETDRENRTIGAASYIHSELSQNLSLLEYAKQELDKDYSQIPPMTPDVTDENKQDLEMGKVRATAKKLAPSLTDSYYMSQLNSGALVMLDNQKLSDELQFAYEGIRHAKDTILWQADFFAKIQDNDLQTPLTKQMEEISRKEKVPQAIQMVREDIELAITRINTARSALNDAVKPYGKEMKTIYRDEAIMEMRRSQEPSSETSE